MQVLHICDDLIWSRIPLIPNFDFRRSSLQLILMINTLWQILLADPEVLV